MGLFSCINDKISNNANYGKSVRDNVVRDNNISYNLRHSKYQLNTGNSNAKATNIPANSNIRDSKSQDSKPNDLASSIENVKLQKIKKQDNEIQQNSNVASKKEQFVLKVSMFSALVLAIFGISFGILVKSNAVIFDGFVALVSVGLGLLSVITSRYIYKEDDDIFQYGYVRFEPMVNLFKSLVLAFVCIYAFINAIQSIVNGGYDVELGGAVIYSIFAFLFCTVLFYYTLFYVKILESDLIKVDNTEWKIDCVLYLGALIAFGFIYFLPYLNSIFSIDNYVKQANLLRYIDPALLAILSLMLCVSPIRIAISNLKDLIMVAPVELDSKITQIMEKLSLEFGFSDYDTHVAKSGRFYMVEVNILTHANFKVSSIQELDSIREKIESYLDIPSYKIWLSVSFTSNPKWL